MRVHTAGQTLLVGATSAIAEAIARRLAGEGSSFYLTGRSESRLEAIAADLRVRGASECDCEKLDLREASALEGLIGRVIERLGGFDTVIVAAGVLPEQSRAQEDTDILRENFETNCLAPGILLEHAAAAMKAQGHGHLLAIGSVAGDRGRAVNYAYGSAKGALEILLSGLRQRLHGSGVQVSLVKPGFVDTPMTSHFQKGLLWSSPDRVAADCIRALRKGRAVTYSPWYWLWILRVIRGLPQPIFDRLRF